MDPINPKVAYKQWATEAPAAYNSEDAFVAGFELALRYAAEKIRRENNPVVKQLRDISERGFPI